MSSSASSSSLPSATFWRSLQTLNVSRVVVAIVLFGYMSLKGGKEIWLTEYTVFTQACTAYLIIAIFFVLIKINYQRRFMLQLASQIALDVIIISIIYLASGGNKSGLAILYIFPLAGVGILAPLLWGLFFAKRLSTNTTAK